MMPELIIYHNGVCTKSNGALELLIRENIPHTIRWYMQEPLSEDELRGLLVKLGLPASALVRTYEEEYKALWGERELSDEACFRLLLDRPSLMQRPIVEVGERAIVARPAEAVFELF